MRWDQEEVKAGEPMRAHRPVPDAIASPGRNLRHPAMHAEIQRRVAIYERQVERTGRIKWLPFRGSGD